MKKFFVMTLAVAAASVAVANENLLLPGDAAPKIEVSKWVKGDKVTEYKKDMVYVVEFWATWCGPCKTSIPHLTKLQDQYEGKVHFTGVSVWESDPKNEKIVTDFVAEWGDKMDYAVAIDKYTDMDDRQSGVMAETWMRAAKRRGIPSAFIVKNGVVQWVGHPMQMDQPLADVVAGKFDVVAYRAAYEKEIQPVIEQEKLMARIAAAQEAFKMGKTDVAGKEIDSILATGTDAQMNLAIACRQEATTEEGNKAYAMMLADKISEKVNHPVALFYASYAYEANEDMAKAVAVLETALKNFDASEDPAIKNLQGFREALTNRIAVVKKEQS